MNYKLLKSKGSCAKLSTKNPLAFNGHRSERISRYNSQNNEGTFDFKLIPNPNLAPPVMANLKEAGYLLAQIEQIKYTQIGRRSNLKHSEHRKQHDYFISSSTRWAWCSFLFKRYYEKSCFTKGEVTSQLDISSKATLQLVNYAQDHGMVVWEHGKCYRATELFNLIYMEYIGMQTDTLMPLWSKMSVFMTASDHLLKDLKKEEVTSHLTSQTQQK